MAKNKHKQARWALANVDSLDSRTSTRARTVLNNYIDEMENLTDNDDGKAKLEDQNALDRVAWMKARKRIAR